MFLLAVTKESSSYSTRSPISTSKAQAQAEWRMDWGKPWGERLGSDSGWKV